MRALILSLFFVFAGCDDSSVRGPEAPDVAATPGSGPSGCVDKCVDSRAMEARSPDDIRRDCEKECAAK